MSHDRITVIHINKKFGAESHLRETAPLASIIHSQLWL